MANTFLGTDKHGYKYYREISDGQDYVYQYKSDETPNGWICSYGAWLRSLHKLIVVPAGAE